MGEIAASLLAAFASAVSSDQVWPAYVGPSGTLTARVVASREVVLFEGDLAVTGQVYVVAPVNAPRDRMKVFIGSGDCDAARNDGRTYRMHLSRGRIFYGLTANPEDREWTTSLVISSCVPIAQ